MTLTRGRKELEHIGSILQRVSVNLKPKFKENYGARSLDPCGIDTLTIDSGAPSLSGGETTIEGQNSEPL